MEKILSQDEVDALLRGVSDGGVETEPESQAGEDYHDGPVPYDLGNQEWVVRGRMPTLDVIHQQFSRLFRVALSDILRKSVEVTVTNQSVMKFGEFTKRLPVPAYLQIISMEPLRGSGCGGYCRQTRSDEGAPGIPGRRESAREVPYGH